MITTIPVASGVGKGPIAASEGGRLGDDDDMVGSERNHDPNPSNPMASAINVASNHRYALRRDRTGWSRGGTGASGGGNVVSATVAETGNAGSCALSALWSGLRNADACVLSLLWSDGCNGGGNGSATIVATWCNASSRSALLSATRANPIHTRRSEGAIRASARKIRRALTRSPRRAAHAPRRNHCSRSMDVSSPTRPPRHYTRLSTSQP